MTRFSFRRSWVVQQWRLALTTLFVLAFIGYALDGWRAFGLYDYLRNEPAGLRQAFNPNFSTDGYIRALLQHEGVPIETVRQPTDAIRAALETLPPGVGVIIVFPSDTPNYRALYATLRYLTLPRNTYYMPCVRSDWIPPDSIPPDGKPAAVISYLVEPPRTILGHWRLLPGLTLTPALEAEAWKLYCSR